MLPTTIPTPEAVSRGLWLLENARHSHELNLLDKQTLVELCRQKLGPQDVDYEVIGTSSLVESLSNWVCTFQ